jgi:tryptophan synthase beta chain
MNIIEQEVSTERWIDIPEPVLDILYRWRPAPLRRAVYLEKYLKTPARIYYKDESTSPPGSHKPNTAVAQAYYNKEFGIKRLTTETGAGQWGSALAFACALLGLECKVFMVRISFDQKPFRKFMMETWGALCREPSTETNAGADGRDAGHAGQLGIASRSVEQAVTDPTGQDPLSLGSVLILVCAPVDHRMGRRSSWRRPGRSSDIIIGGTVGAATSPDWPSPSPP